MEENEWERAVKDACMCVFLDWAGLTPREVLQKLLLITEQMALDPSISKGAQELLSRPR